MGQVSTLEHLDALRQVWRTERKSVVWTNGCFDLLHSGHVRSLQAAKREGDILLVGVNSDRAVRQIKGSNRPILPEMDRAELVAALGCVDYVVIFDESTPERILAQLTPDIHCKGADYANGNKPMPELATVLSYGGRVVFLDLQEGRSTTNLLAKVQSLALDHEASHRVEAGGNDQILSKFLSERMAGANVLVVGDVMLDEYVMGAISRISPEAPVPVLDILERRFSCGGAANVAVNVAGLGAGITLVGLVAEDSAGATLKVKLGESGVRLEGLLVPEDRHTICKTRFVAGQQQIVRVDQENKRPITRRDQIQLLSRMKGPLDTARVCVLSDYGKGIFCEDFCQEAIQLARNANRPVVVDPKGRRFDIYRGCSVITPNLKETAISAGIEIEDEDDLRRAADVLLKILPGTALLITRGPQGMTLFTETSEPLTIPTVARHVYDVVGAGDTAVATLAVALGSELGIETGIHLANLAAGIVVEKHGTVAIQMHELLNRLETNGLLSLISEPRSLQVLATLV